MDYDIIVVGAGHAGCESALVCARKKYKTLLITSNLNNIADLACNPSIGGSAKGVVVREIDALGGEMGKNTDKSLIQIKMLNYKKGAAVQALRAQVDKLIYPKNMKETLLNQSNLELLEGMVEDLIVDNNTVSGVILNDGTKITSKIVILTTGTYLKSDILLGDTRLREGPHGEKPSLFLSDKLKEYGFKIIRLKTGTPQRIDKNTVNYSQMKIEKGDEIVRTFSFQNKVYYNPEEQEICYLLYTTDETHKIIQDNIKLASMYGGLTDIESVGPRYCPSIEDKIVRFYDKEKHQLFLEPESRLTDELYLQGFSTSMPHYIQDIMVKSLPGLENAKILKYAYAIEYDAISSTQLKMSLETKIINNLFTAGQINGTSGYEEAAAQGLMAGINACLKLENKEPFVLKRNEAYIGVLIDDLITKGVIDPYRLLTSRAEYRLLLRHDNADIRLKEYGYKYGLIEQNEYNNFKDKLEKIEKLTDDLKKYKLTPTPQTLKELNDIGTTPIRDSITLYDLLKRQEINISCFKQYIDIDYNKEIIEDVEINNKYEGYITKAQKEAEKMLNYENKKIPTDIDYYKIKNLASEAKQKLNDIRPDSIGQALRISGVNPSDITILILYIKKEYYYDNR